MNFGLLFIAFELSADVLEMFYGILVFSDFGKQLSDDFMCVNAEFIKGQFFVVSLEVLVEDGQSVVDVFRFFFLL